MGRKPPARFVSNRRIKVPFLVVIGAGVCFVIYLNHFGPEKQAFYQY